MCVVNGPAGVPIPLLPHEVAVKGLRPKWPSSLPPQYRDLQALAEACWAQEPQARWGGATISIGRPAGS
jgi:hypothetical protein